MPRNPSLIRFLIYFALSVFVMRLWQPHGEIQGDIWNLFASSRMGQYPLCVGTIWLNPYRPLATVPLCAAYHAGLSLTAMFAIQAAVTAALAIAWASLVKVIFKIEDGAAFIVGLVIVALPDTTYGQSLIVITRQVGQALMIAGALLYIRRGQAWIAGALCLIGLLSYEHLIVLWLIGVPIGAWMVSARLTRRDLVVAGAPVALYGVFCAVRAVTLPADFFIEGMHHFNANPAYIFVQAMESVFRLAFPVAVMSVGNLAALIFLLGIIIVFCYGILTRHSMILASLFVLVAAGAPFYFSADVRFDTETFRSLGTPFALSLVMAAISYDKAVRRSLALIMVGLMIRTQATQYEAFSTVWTAQDEFFATLHANYPTLDRTWIIMETTDPNFRDAYQMSSRLAFEYGQAGTPYTAGIDGHSGFTLTGVDRVEAVEGGWRLIGAPPMVLSRHMPDPLPADRTIILNYRTPRTLSQRDK